MNPSTPESPVPAPTPTTIPSTDTVPPTMRAVVCREYGSADVLHVDVVPTPAPAAGEVLVHVGAAGLDRGTWHLMTGMPRLMRLVTGLRRPRHPGVGRDLAGTVVTVGAGVTRFAVGDRVFGTGNASFAEYAVVPEKRLAAMPATASIEEAAVVPVSGQTALQALDAGRVVADSTVLVIGASGGVGTYAVQLAAALGARVTAVCSGPKADLVRSLGAVQVLDYTNDEVPDRRSAYDVIIDIAGNRPIRDLRRGLTATGTLVAVGGEEGGDLTGGMHRQVFGAARSLFSRQRVVMLVAKEGHADLERLARLIDDGALRPSLDRACDLDGAADAMRDLAAGRVRGKVAVVPG